MEKREHQRFAVDRPIQAINQLDDQELGRLINLSEGGFMAVCGTAAPEPGNLLQLTLRDPQHQALEIHGGVRCVWRERTHGEDGYWCGFQFIDLSEEDRARLRDYLATLGKL